MMAFLSINMKLGQRILSTKTTQKIIDINDYIIGTVPFEFKVSMIALGLEFNLSMQHIEESK